jgi:hypothetical protein
MKNKTYTISIGELQDALDMKRFLRPQLELWVAMGILPALSDLEERLDGIIHRANGRFLWAMLLIAYVGSRRLSFSQRLDALDNLSRLEGLDETYTEIVTRLQGGVSEVEITNVQRVFR